MSEFATSIEDVNRILSAGVTTAGLARSVPVLDRDWRRMRGDPVARRAYWDALCGGGRDAVLAMFPPEAAADEPIEDIVLLSIFDEPLEALARCACGALKTRELGTKGYTSQLHLKGCRRVLNGEHVEARGWTQESQDLDERVMAKRGDFRSDCDSHKAASNAHDSFDLGISGAGNE